VPALAAYDDRFAQWPRRRDNCTLVSNSGILVAALAVLGRYSDLSQQLVCRSLVSSWNAFDRWRRTERGPADRAIGRLPCAMRA